MRKYLLPCLVLFITFSPIFAQHSPSESLLFKIIKKKEMNVSVAMDNKPYFIVNPKEGYPGFEAELAYMYAEYIGVSKVNFFPMPNFAEHAKALELGKVDIAIGNSTSLSRGKQVDFSDFYIATSIGALVDKSIIPPEQEGDVVVRSLRSLMDLKQIGRVSFGVKDKTSNYEFLLKNFSEFPCQPFSNDELAIAALRANKINTYSADNLYIEAILQQYPELRTRYVALLNPIIEKQQSFAIKKYDLQLLHSINFFIREMKRSGEITRLKEKYFNSNSWVNNGN
jgi:polar amino acid transport system substrate-binding protein